MEIHNWKLCTPYAPHDNRLCLAGNVYGHPYINNGEHITTNFIVSGFMEGDNIIVKTLSGSEYTLGQVDGVYEKMFPNARARVIAQFT